jgi:hypothetical protein
VSEIVTLLCFSRWKLHLQARAVAERVAEAVGEILHGEHHLADALIPQPQQHPLDEGLVDEGDHGLGGVACEGAKARAEATDKDHCFHERSFLRLQIGRWRIPMQPGAWHIVAAGRCRMLSAS